MRTVGMWCNRIWFIAARQQENHHTTLMSGFDSTIARSQSLQGSVWLWHHLLPSKPRRAQRKKSTTHPSSMWKNLICPNFPTSLCWCCRKHRGSYSGVLITCPVLYVRSCCAALNSLNTHTALHHCHQDGFLHSTALTTYRWLSFSSWPTDNPHCAC